VLSLTDSTWPTASDGEQSLPAADRTGAFDPLPTSAIFWSTVRCALLAAVPRVGQEILKRLEDQSFDSAYATRGRDRDRPTAMRAQDQPLKCRPANVNEQLDTVNVGAIVGGRSTRFRIRGRRTVIVPAVNAKLRGLP